jgi:hypothetical protein
VAWEMATCCGWVEGRRGTRYSRPSPAEGQLRFAFFSFFTLVGGAVSGDRVQGPKAGDGAAGVAVGGVDARAGAFDTTLAALPRLWRRRWRRRRFLAAAKFTAGAGKLQVTVRT